MTVGQRQLLHHLRTRDRPLPPPVSSPSILQAAYSTVPLPPATEPALRDVPELPPAPDHPTAPGDCSAIQQAPRSYEAPPPCSLLCPGLSFEGVQHATVPAGRCKSREEWRVSVTLHSYDHACGYICGEMQASNLPEEAVPVTTFFEGEVVDNVHHTFFTPSWEATASSDLRHWAKLPGFSRLHAEVVANNGRAPSLTTHPWVYMRWKELFFVSRSSDCHLSIAGFYYIALHRTTGAVAGFYFDPSSVPEQALVLAPARHAGKGVAFAGYVLA